MSEHIKKQFADRANQLSTAPTGARHWEICSHHNSVQTVITFLANTYKYNTRSEIHCLWLLTHLFRSLKNHIFMIKAIDKY